MVGVYSRGLTASNPQKYPPGPATEALAAEMYQKNKAYGAVYGANVAAPFKESEIDIKRLNQRLEEFKAGQDAEKKAAETEAKIQELVTSAKRQKRDALDDAETKGYKGKKGAEGKALLESEIEAAVRANAAPKATAPAAKPAPAKAAAPKKDGKTNDGWGDVRVK
jgi:hypothetical protein